MVKKERKNAIFRSIYFFPDVAIRPCLQIGCDENVHNMGWGWRKTNAREETFMDFIIEKNLFVNKV